MGDSYIIIEILHFQKIESQATYAMYGWFKTNYQLNVDPATNGERWREFEEANIQRKRRENLKMMDN